MDFCQNLVKADYLNALPKIVEIKFTVRKRELYVWMYFKKLPVGLWLYSTYQWLEGSVWGSLAELDQKRWKNREQRGSWRSWGPQTAGWTVPLLWSCQKGCRTKLPRPDQGEMQKGHWISPRAPETASWQLHTESHVCFPPGKQEAR